MEEPKRTRKMLDQEKALHFLVNYDCHARDTYVLYARLYIHERGYNSTVAANLIDEDLGLKLRVGRQKRGE